MSQAQGYRLASPRALAVHPHRFRSASAPEPRTRSAHPTPCARARPHAYSLQVIGIVLGLHGGIDGDVGGAFFYSRVSCCGVSGTAKELPAKYDFHYPYTLYVYGVNTSHIKGCDLPGLDHNNAFWSHSAYCINWNYVKDFTQNLSADRSLYLQLTGAAPSLHGLKVEWDCCCCCCCC